MRLPFPYATNGGLTKCNLQRVFKFNCHHKLIYMASDKNHTVLYNNNIIGLHVVPKIKKKTYYKSFNI